MLNLGLQLTGKDGLLANKLLLKSRNLKLEDTNKEKIKMRRKEKSQRFLMDLKSGVDQIKTTSLITSTLKNGRNMTGKNLVG